MMWVFFAIISVVIFPIHAFAFGPVTHFELGWQLATALQEVPGLLSIPLTALMMEFLLGNVVPDNVLAKNLARLPRHSHNWENGFSLLESALNDHERAVALGYLGHLAADVVAHNLYVPAVSLLKYDANRGGHVSWEIKMDKLMIQHPQEYKALSDRSEYFKYDYFLKKIIRGTILRGRINNRISRRVFSIAGSIAEPKGRIRSLNPDNQPPLEIINLCRKLAFQSMYSLVRDMKDSPVVRMDPRGKEIAKFVRKQRRQMRMELKNGITAKTELDKRAGALASELILALTNVIPEI